MAEINNKTSFVGKTFRCYAEFEMFLREREARTGEKWVKGRGNKTVRDANSTIKKSNLHYKEEFGYSRIYFQCIHSGVFQSRAHQRRSSSNKLGCQAKIMLSADRKADVLVVKQCMLRHNHPLKDEEAELECYIDDDQEREEIKALLSLNVDAAQICGYKKVPPRPVPKPPLKRELEREFEVSNDDKRCKATDLATELIEVLSTCDDELFRRRCNSIKKTMSTWRKQAQLEELERAAVAREAKRKALMATAASVTVVPHTNTTQNTNSVTRFIILQDNTLQVATAPTATVTPTMVLREDGKRQALDTQTSTTISADASNTSVTVTKSKSPEKKSQVTVIVQRKKEDGSTPVCISGSPAQYSLVTDTVKNALKQFLKVQK